MAPAPRSSQAQRRATQSQNEHVYELGKVGRKTGVTLPDNGERDEYGFEDPNIFSSPDKGANGANGYDRETPSESGGEEMDLDDGSEMGPATIRKLQERPSRPSLPRARSPIKTNIGSPARHNPHLGPTSSPTRGSVVEAPSQSPARHVKRKLNFSKNENPLTKPLSNGQPKANGSRIPNGKPNRHTSHSDESNNSDEDEEEDDDDEDIPRTKPQKPTANDEEEENDDEEEEPMEVLDMGDDDADLPEPDQVEPEAEEGEEDVTNEQVEEEETEEVQAQPAKRRGRKPKQPPPAKNAQPQSPVAEPVKKRGRPARNAPQEEPKASSSSKRGRPARSSLGNAEEEEEVAPKEEREPKRQRTEKASSKDKTASAAAASNEKAVPPKKEKGKPGRKRKSSGVGVDSPVVQRGPPLPRARGLVSMRREGTDTARTTRSGRISVKPLEFWKGEHYEFDDDAEEVYGDKRSHFVFNKVKGVVRAEEPEPVAKTKRGGRGRPPSGRPPKSGRGRRSSGVDDDIEEGEEPEEWEEDPGRVVGECLHWFPEYQDAPPTDEDRIEVIEEELAISSAAINLRDIKDATFKFAKTLTLPFFGAGVVDLPPGSEKHPKNSRKMQMVFFVHTGSVTVTIADQNTFRITKGGMWFVPRGNRYQIKNEGDRTARLFFAQGCEVHWQPEAEEA